MKISSFILYIILIDFNIILIIYYIILMFITHEIKLNIMFTRHI